MRWVALAAGLAVGVGVLATGLVFVVSERALDRAYTIPESALTLAIERTPRSLARGRHLATTVAQCHFCHGTDLAGRSMADDPLIGRLHAANLTSGEGGIGRDYAVEDWVRAIRFGVGRDGRSLLLMPSEHLSRMTDVDLAALIAYLEEIPPIDRHVPTKRAGWLTRLALAMGSAPELLSASRVVDASPRWRGEASPESAEYGAYLVDLGSCRTCHRADLRGGLHPLALPGEPAPPDLRPGGALTGWSRSDFARAMRRGETPDGRRLDREFMPWPAFAGLSELELDAMWLYLNAGAPRDAKLAVAAQ